MRPPATTLIVLTATLAFAGIAAACGGSDDDASPASTGSPVSTSEPDLTDTTTEATDPPTTEAPVETVPPATEPPATEAPAVDAGECLVGEWVVTEEQMDAYYAGVMSTLDAPLAIDTEGAAPLTFAADGTYSWAPAFALAVEVGGQAGTGDVSGTITGDWIARDGVVTTSSDANALAVSIEVNGITFDGDDLANGMLNSSPVNGVTYSCDGPTPVLDFQTSDPAVTVPVTLTPA